MLNFLRKCYSGEAPSTRRQIIIIDSAFPIKSDARFGSQIRQVEKVDSEQGFRIHNFNFLFLGG